MRLPLTALVTVTVAVASALEPIDTLGQVKFGVGPGDWHPSNLEVLQLPRFCWGQFRVQGADGPEYNIRDCGPYANHYCFGLTYLLRAKKWTGKGKPTGTLGRADSDIRYTENGIKDYPQCSIRNHVADTRAEINTLMRLYGVKPSP